MHDRKSNLGSQSILAVMFSLIVFKTEVMVSTLDSEASRVGSNPGRVYFVLFLARKFTLTVPLSTQEYKLVPANLMLGEPFRG